MGGVHFHAERLELRKSARQRFGLEAQAAGDQHLVVGQRDRAGAVIDRRKRRQELGDALHAGLRLELLDLQHEVMQVLRCRGDHRQRDVRHGADAFDDVAGGNAHDPGFADRLGGGWIGLPGEGDRLGEAVSLAEQIDHRLVAGHGDAIQLHPAFDHDEECVGWIALAKHRLALAQDHHRRGRDQALHH